MCPTRSTEAEEWTIKLVQKTRGSQRSRCFSLPGLPVELLPEPSAIQVHRGQRVPTGMASVHPGILKCAWKSERNYKKKHVLMSGSVITIEKKCLMGSRRCFWTWQKPPLKVKPSAQAIWYGFHRTSNKNNSNTSSLLDARNTATKIQELNTATWT